MSTSDNSDTPAERASEQSPTKSPAAKRPRPGQDHSAATGAARGAAPSASRRIDIPNSQAARVSIDDKLPLWIGGSSPAKFIPFEDLVKMNDSLEKMAIVRVCT